VQYRGSIMVKQSREGGAHHTTDRAEAEAREAGLASKVRVRSRFGFETLLIAYIAVFIC
jgi:hypothetical protein